MRRALLLLLVASRAASAQPSAADRFDQGQAAFDRRDYAIAIATWQQLYRDSAEPELLYDVGQAYRLAGDCRRALESYRAFLAAPSASPRRARAAEFVDELAPRCSPAPTPAPARGTLQMSGIGLAVGGGLALVAGLALGRHAQTLARDVTRECVDGCAWPAERGRDADGRRDATVGFVLDGVGVAALVVGAGLYLWGMRERASALTLQRAPDATTISWSRAW